MTISEKVAYLKGLAEGMKLDTEESKEGKLISVMIGILEEVGLSIEDMEDNMEAMGEEIDAISDDLSDVEKVVFDEDDEDEDDEDECGCDEDDDFFEVECPNCGEELVIDEDVLEAGTVECPNCKEPLVIDEDVLEAGVIECPSCHSQFAVSDEEDGECGCDHEEE